LPLPKYPGMHTQSPDSRSTIPKSWHSHSVAVLPGASDQMHSPPLRYCEIRVLYRGGLSQGSCDASRLVSQVSCCKGTATLMLMVPYSAVSLPLGAQFSTLVADSNILTVVTDADTSPPPLRPAVLLASSALPVSAIEAKSSM